MKALILRETKRRQEIEEQPKPEPLLGQVRIKLKRAALNHRDVYITQGLYPGISLPIVLGSDGAGIVDALGKGVDEQLLGKEVLMQPGRYWGQNPNVQGFAYQILGMPEQGCFAEYVCVDAEQVKEKPASLSWEGAAALPLAGLTAWRALITKAGLQAGERVLVSGIGGGVALFAAQFALAAGAELWVTSGKDEKIAKAQKLGAKGGVNYKAENWHKELLGQADGGFDVIIDSAGGPGFSKFIDLANPAGRIAFYGGTRGNFQINPQKMFWKQLSVFGSTMGTDAEFDEMLQFVEKHKLEPVVDSVLPLSQGAEAFERMDKGEQFGKLLLDCTN